jgi:hypothetical protein
VTWRVLPPVAAQLGPGSLGLATVRVVTNNAAPTAALQSLLTRELAATSVLLTDGGTAALALALDALLDDRRIVALPAYGCADLVSAALAARATIVCYDLDPSTLGPDLDSARLALQAGASVIVGTHLYGIPFDVPALREIADVAGAVVVEDTAQGLGALLGGRPCGALADVGVLSFGRGKGVSGGAGGALLLRNGIERRLRTSPTLQPASRGLGPVGASWVQWALGRPSLYRIPTALPFLKLGEMVFHEAEPPRAMPSSCATLALSSWQALRGDVAVRQRHAAALAACPRAPGKQAIQPVRAADPSWLRWPVLDRSGGPWPTELGVQQGYPMSIPMQPWARAALAPSTRDMPGAEQLSRELRTLPTHHLVRASDIAALATWLRSDA